MSDPESSSPVLSYKKPSKADKSKSSPALPPAQTDTLTVPNPHTPRVVSSRRKALQDFYNLHNTNPTYGEGHSESSKNDSGAVPSASKGQGEPEISLESHVDEISLRAKQLSDPAELDNFIKQSDVEQILKVRNHISSGLNQHDSEKKSMVYDNYSELIKLSDILAALNDTKSDKSPDFSMGLAETAPQVTATYIDSVLAELNGMLVSDGPVFNQEFHKVIETISASFDDADSLASVKGISE